MRTLKERFEEKIFYSPDGCWYWTGATTRGYGMLLGDNHRNVYAYRVSHELYKGPIPDGICVCHHCDNPPCVNPNHLFLGTHSDNIKDAYDKGRVKLTSYIHTKPMGPRREWIGEKHNKLTVVAYSHYSNAKHFWLCRCECGKEKVVAASNLTNNQVKSCGCLLHTRLFSKEPI